MAIDPSDLLGTPAGYATKEQIAAAQALSQLLMKPQQQTMYHPIQGLSNVADALIGGYFGHLADQRRLANMQKSGRAQDFNSMSVIPPQPAPAQAAGGAAAQPAAQPSPVRTAALADTATDAAMAGPPPFSQSIVKAVSPGIGVSSVNPTAGPTATGNAGMTATVGALTGGSPASPSAPVQTAQASGVAPVAPEGPLSPQRGLFVDPDKIPQVPKISRQQMMEAYNQAYLGLTPWDNYNQMHKLYYEQFQPYETDTPLGKVVVNRQDPTNQVRWPHIEQRVVKPGGGIEIPQNLVRTPWGEQVVPTLAPGQSAYGGQQTGARPAGGGFPMTGDIQQMKDWQIAQGAKESAVKKDTDAAYAKQDEIDKGAANALSIKSRITEMRNLASQINPNNAAQWKEVLGNWLQSAGVSNKTATDWLGTNPGNKEAFDKIATTLAAELGAQSFPRLTQYEFQTILKNATPNSRLLPEALGRITDFMDKQADQNILKQQNWNAWKNERDENGNPKNKITDWHSWETDWNKKQEELIKSGALTSKPGTVGGPQSERPVPVNTPEEARKLQKGTRILLPDGTIGRVP